MYPLIIDHTEACGREAPACAEQTPLQQMIITQILLLASRCVIKKTKEDGGRALGAALSAAFFLILNDVLLVGLNQ